MRHWGVPFLLVLLLLSGCASTPRQSGPVTTEYGTFSNSAEAACGWYSTDDAKKFLGKRWAGEYADCRSHVSANPQTFNPGKIPSPYAYNNSKSNSSLAASMMAVSQALIKADAAQADIPAPQITRTTCRAASRYDLSCTSLGQ